MHVLLVATHWTPTFENCRRSLNIFNYEYTILGWGEEWKGWTWRTQLYLEELSKRDPNEIVVMLDAYDTIAARDAKGMEEAFQAFGTDIVFGAEWYCGEETCGNISRWWDIQNRKPSYRQYINAGCIIGKVHALLKAYNWSKKYTDDQKGLAEYINLFPSTSLAIDSGSSIVHNVHICDALTSSPFFYHFPGPMLKRGLFRQYNVVANTILKASARKQYPSDTNSVFIFSFICMVCMFYINIK